MNALHQATAWLARQNWHVTTVAGIQRGQNAKVNILLILDLYYMFIKLFSFLVK